MITMRVRSLLFAFDIGMQQNRVFLATKPIWLIEPWHVISNNVAF